MYKASAGVLLPTSIIGSLPRPAWHTVQLGSRSFLEAMVNARWREQYEDAVSTHPPAQEVAGLDICTDGDAHYDEEIGGWSWQSYPLTHMAGFSREVALTPPAVAAASPPRGAILHDQLEARVLPRRDHNLRDDNDRLGRRQAQNGGSPDGGPMVRILLPPAQSLVRTFPRGAVAGIRFLADRPVAWVRIGFGSTPAVRYGPANVRKGIGALPPFTGTAAKGSLPPT
jgi:hypothetical protein